MTVRQLFTGSRGHVVACALLLAAFGASVDGVEVTVVSGCYSELICWSPLTVAVQQHRVRRVVGVFG